MSLEVANGVGKLWMEEDENDSSESEEDTLNLRIR